MTESVSGPDQVFVARRIIPDTATHDLAARRQVGAAYWLAVAAATVLALAGIAALVLRAAEGPAPRERWGYTAGALAFLLSTAQAAPLVAFIGRAGHAFWDAPGRRAAELWAVGGIVTAPVFILLLFELPSLSDRQSLWAGWPGAPHLWDGVAVAVLVLLGLAWLFLASLPDLAALRDLAVLRDLAGGEPHRPTAIERRGRLALGWRGRQRQWQALSAGLTLLGATYALLFVFVQLLLISDMGMSLVPGWSSANMPPYHVVTSIEGGIALWIVTLAVARRAGRLEQYVHRDTFHAAAKLLLALALLWFYFFWAEFLTYWYGRTPNEQHLIDLLITGPYLGPFVVAFAGCFAGPFLLLLWNRVRAGIAGPACAAVLALVGLFFDRIRLYVAAWSAAGLTQEHLETIPPARLPDTLDVLILLGLPAAVAVLSLMALRVVPPISLWEHKRAHLLRLEGQYLRRLVAVLAKPD